MKFQRYVSGLLMVAILSCFGCSHRQEAATSIAVRNTSPDGVIFDDHGAIIRGDASKREIALVFTGDTYADGAKTVLNVLEAQDVKASFFFTGNFYRHPDLKALIVALKEGDHYLGAHSDKHLLYADWARRDSLLVTEREFKEDLMTNYEQMEGFGIGMTDAPYFMPPYEWYNSRIVKWTRDLGLHLINFTPGTRSAADYTYPEMGSRYVSSDEIYNSVLALEERDPHGLNGFILLIHIGSDPRRIDKFYNSLDMLISELRERGYAFKTITELLEADR